MAGGSTVLVTGGAGYIGSHTVRALGAAGMDVVVLDSLEFGRREAVVDAPLVVGDVHDSALVEQVCRDHGVGSVIHFAAYKAVGESMEQPGRYWHNNVDGTVALVEAAMRAGASEFVFSSTCAVYGTPAEVPVAETSPIAPESVYAETKAMVERILGWYGTTHGLRSVSLRYFNAAGASFDGRIGEDWSMSLNLVPLVMRALLVPGPAIKVFGTDYPTPDGTCIRDYIHVEDLADAHVKAVAHLAGGGDNVQLNVGTGVGSSVFEVIAAAEKVAGRAVPKELTDRRPGDPVATFADPSTAESVLGWRAAHGLTEIVETAYRWHSSTV
ncbi:MAG: UDP-glucose 4-epimerase GalE [Acidimicrobiia bacterium]|nr:UDP-glucose 4-epimerase GalE [Acidimicrobiia bacterium]